jgi:hypothetical protein
VNGLCLMEPQNMIELIHGRLIMSERERRERAGYPVYLAGISKATEKLRRVLQEYRR